MYSMADYKSVKGQIIVFTCNYCSFTKENEDCISDLTGNYKSIGYVLLTINLNDIILGPTDSCQMMQKHAKE